MRLPMIVAVFTLLGLVSGQGAADQPNATKKPVRHVEKAGGYSFVPPAGWTMREIPGMKYKAAFGSAANGFAPNINFVDEANKGRLADYVAANKRTLAKVFKNYKELGEKDLKTAGGVACVVLVTQSEHNGKTMRQSFYFFDISPGKKLVATCSALADGGAKLDPVFEASLKTFRVEKP